MIKEAEPQKVRYEKESGTKPCRKPDLPKGYSLAHGD
jgi:hypothetical protein